MTVTHTANIGLISNRHSGHNRTHFEKFSARVADCPHIIHIATESAADIPQALAEFARRQVSIVAINGGDGTVAAILGALLQSRLFPVAPQIVLLPGGTANMTAGDIGVRGDLLKATRRLCEWAAGPQSRTGNFVSRSLLQVRQEQTTEVHYGMFLGAGVVLKGTEYAHREIHSRGLRDGFSVGLSTLRTVWGVVRGDPQYTQAVAIQVTLDEAPPRQHASLLLVVSTLQRLALGMRPFWGSGPGAIRLTLIEQRNSRFLRTFISIIRGRPNRNAIAESGYFSHNVQRLRLNLVGGLNLDGEIINASGDFTIEATPALEFLRL